MNPATDLQPLYMQFGVSSVMSGGAGELTSAMMNGTVAHISARNLSTSTSFTFFFRYGIEMQVVPRSTLAPQMKLSPPYDAVALNAYFAIARELKDAYPANYNDLGKLWDVISNAARTVLPFIGVSGPAGRAVQFGANAILNVGDNVRKRRKKKKAVKISTIAKGVARTAPPAPPRTRGTALSASEVEAYRKTIAAARMLTGQK